MASDFSEETESDEGRETFLYDSSTERACGSSLYISETVSFFSILIGLARLDPSNKVGARVSVCVYARVKVNIKLA